MDRREGQWTWRLVSFLRLVLALTAGVFLLRGQIPHAIGTALGLAISFLPSRMAGACQPQLIAATEIALSLSVVAGMTGGQLLGLFKVIPNYDKALHAINPVMLSFLSLLICYDLVQQDRLHLPSIVYTAVVVLAILGISGLWEVLEYLGDQLFAGIWAQGSPAQDPLLDTMLDMTMNLIGSVLGAILATLTRHRAWSFEWVPRTSSSH